MFAILGYGLSLFCFLISIGYLELQSSIPITNSTNNIRVYQHAHTKECKKGNNTMLPYCPNDMTRSIHYDGKPLSENTFEILYDFEDYIFNFSYPCQTESMKHPSYLFLCTAVNDNQTTYVHSQLFPICQSSMNRYQYIKCDQGDTNCHSSAKQFIQDEKIIYHKSWKCSTNQHFIGGMEIILLLLYFLIFISNDFFIFPVMYLFPPFILFWFWLLSDNDSTVAFVFHIGVLVVAYFHFQNKPKKK